MAIQATPPATPTPTSRVDRPLRYDDIPERTAPWRAARCSIRWAAAYTAIGRRGPTCCCNGRAQAAAKPLRPVWGDKAPALRAADAALVNGTSAHAFELDDYHNAKLHPGAVVVSAALAMAEQTGANGKQLLTAIVTGYEVMIRTSLALNPSAARLRGWHRRASAPPGAAAACAVLLGLDAEHTAWALGLAARKARAVAFNADGTMSKRLHAGKAAHSGVLAAELAASGYTGPTQIYEFEDGGMLKAYSDMSDPAPLTRALGRVLSPRRHGDQAILVLRQHARLRRRGAPAPPQARTPWDASRPGARRHEQGRGRAMRHRLQPDDGAQCQMSLRYIVAAALLDGQALPPQFSDDRIRNREVVELARRLELVKDPDLDQLYPVHFAGWVAAQHEGNWVRADILDPSGSHAAPIDARGITEKFGASIRNARRKNRGCRAPYRVSRRRRAPAARLGRRPRQQRTA